MFMNMPFERINITLPPKTVEKLKRISKQQERSQSNMIAFLIERYED